MPNCAFLVSTCIHCTGCFITTAAESQELFLVSLESAHICVVAPVFAGCGVEATEAETCPLFLCSGIWSLLAVISSLLKCSVLSVFVSLGIILTELSAFNVRKQFSWLQWICWACLVTRSFHRYCQLHQWQSEASVERAMHQAARYTIAWPNYLVVWHSYGCSTPVAFPSLPRRAVAECSANAAWT